MYKWPLGLFDPLKLRIVPWVPEKVSCPEEVNTVSTFIIDVVLASYIEPVYFKNASPFIEPVSWAKALLSKALLSDKLTPKPSLLAVPLTLLVKLSSAKT